MVFLYKLVINTQLCNAVNIEIFVVVVGYI